MSSNHFDLIVIGAGAAGLTAAISAARNNKKILLLEQLSKIGTKLKATGGGRCNLTNTLDDEAFMHSFGKNGRFMQDAIKNFNHHDLMEFFNQIGVKTHIPDGFRVFPITHSSNTIIEALLNELEKLNVAILCNQKAKNIITQNNKVTALETNSDLFYTHNIIIATGGLGYPKLGATGDGYLLAKECGHTITPLYPAMMPLHTKETWVANCTADTIAKATITIDIPKLKKIKAQGDLIFTKKGLRGPVILDFAREITPFLSQYKEVPIKINMVKGLNFDQIYSHIKKEQENNPSSTLLQIVRTLLPFSVALEIIKLSHCDPNITFKKQNGSNKDLLIKNIASTPFTIIGHDGFDHAMITRGGIDLKHIDPKTMESKLIQGLYFCGEVLNLDGPCGGYNLQWSFSSGYLAGKLL